jgi:glycosyltransferase involved in cell wall biosynthesis
MTEGKPEIWYLIGGLRIGGAEKTLVQLVNNIDRTEYAVRLISITDDVPLLSDLLPEISFECLHAAGKHDLLTVTKFLYEVRRENPDILQSFLFFDNTLARLAGLVSPSTTVITGVRAVPNDRPVLRSAIDRTMHGLSDHIVSNSRAGANLVIDRGVSPDRVSVVHNGRDIARYREATASPQLYDDLHLADSLVVGTVGRLLERKGHYDLLDAWPAVLEQHPDAVLLFVGDGPEWDGLHRRARELGCLDSVRFAGFRDNVPELLDAMDVFVFPSHFEGLPGALLEAMAAGLPIVTTPVDGCSELVDEDSGVYVEPRSPESIAEGLCRVMADDDLRDRIAARAQERAEAQFSIERMVDGFEALYAQVLLQESN